MPMAMCAFQIHRRQSPSLRGARLGRLQASGTGTGSSAAERAVGDARRAIEEKPEIAAGTLAMIAESSAARAAALGEFFKS